MKIAIFPDDYTPKGRRAGDDAASGRWKDLLEASGCKVKIVDVHSQSILTDLDGCDGFMWRWAHFGGMSRLARRLLPVIERSMGIPVYPDYATWWHYDDKVAQSLLFKAHGIPTPKTWVFYEKSVALAWLKDQQFPLVLKLAAGAGSDNVILLKSLRQAEEVVQQLFKSYVISLKQDESLRLSARLKAFVRQVVLGQRPSLRATGYEPQTGYAYFQEFLSGNDYDTRITVIGNRAFGFRRWNRPGDFRASGSGKIDYSPSKIDERFIRLALMTAQQLGMQSCAIDGMLRNNEPVVGEVSYTFASYAVHECPGHWQLDGDCETGSLIWVDGHMWPEEAQVQDFLVRLQECKA